MPELASSRFANDGDLANVLNGGLRLGAPGTPPFPAPVLSSGPAVAKVQQALIDIGFPMPVDGANGTFGDETGAAVVAFKNRWAITPNDPVIGPKTIAKLDNEMVAFEGRRRFRLHTVISVYDEAGNLIGTHEHTGDLTGP